jgi:hypothetical protein
MIVIAVYPYLTSHISIPNTQYPLLFFTYFYRRYYFRETNNHSLFIAGLVPDGTGPKKVLFWPDGRVQYCQAFHGK